jgi:hypothetical protein
MRSNMKWICYFLLFILSLMSVVVMTTDASIATARSVTFVSTLVAQSPNPQASPVNNSQSASITNLVDWFDKRLPPPRDSQGEVLFCGLAPNRLEKDQSYSVWSDRPLFLWAGNMDQIHVTEISGESVWNSTVTGANSVVYGAEQALTPGKTYNWWADNNSLTPILFRVLPAEKRQEITAELERQATQLRSRKMNAEAIAVAQANYFAQQHLWSDALRVIHSVMNPSSELVQAKQTILTKLTSDICGSPN